MKIFIIFSFSFFVFSFWGMNEGLCKHQRISKNYDKKSFDNNINLLPPHYSGHDIQQLYISLKKKFPPKDEYEDYNAYEKRLKNSLDEIQEFTYAFKLDKYRYLNVDMKYDAENKNYLLDLHSNNEYNFSHLTQEPTISIKVDLNARGENKNYIGMNAFGALRRIVKSSWNEYGIALNKGVEETLKIPVEPEVAKREKDNLRILLICNVTLRDAIPEYFFYSAEYHSPTFDDPFDREVKKFFVYVKLKEIWIFDEKTGEIFLKIKIN